jgi:hypothetical protein
MQYVKMMWHRLWNRMILNDDQTSNEVVPEVVPK